MNTKVATALQSMSDNLMEAMGGQMTRAQARTTLAAHIAQQDAEIARAAVVFAEAINTAKDRIAQQDATIARMREALDNVTALGEAWAGYYARNYLDDKTMDRAAWHPEHRAMIDAARAALNQGEWK